MVPTGTGSSGSDGGTAAGRLQPPRFAGRQQRRAGSSGVAHPAQTLPSPGVPIALVLSLRWDSPPPRCPDTTPSSGSPCVLVPESSPFSAGGSRAGLELASPSPGKEEAAVGTADAGDQHQLPSVKGCSRTAGAVGCPEGSRVPRAAAQVSQDHQSEAGWCQPNQANYFSYPEKKRLLGAQPLKFQPKIISAEI